MSPRMKARMRFPPTGPHSRTRPTTWLILVETGLFGGGGGVLGSGGGGGGGGDGDKTSFLPLGELNYTFVRGQNSRICKKLLIFV